jgi:hypothetical protein
MLHSVRRAAALVAAPALATLALVATPTPASAVTVDPAPASAGASWLTAQLTGGVVYNDQYAFDDLGLSADIALSLKGLGGHAATVSAVAAAVEPRAHDEWYTDANFGGSSLFAGSLAKAAVLAQAAGSDATDFGGHDLIADLAGTVSTADLTAGRVQDQNNAYGDTNAFGQAYAAQALDAAGSAVTESVTDFLLTQQCTQGWFRLDFADRSASDQTCDGDATSTPDTDATAVAVLALASQAGDADVAAAFARSKAWLRSIQKADGSFGGGTSTEAANANSTGLAGTALATLGDTVGATKAAAWVRAHQATNVGLCRPYAAADAGSIAYDTATLAALAKAPLAAATRDKARRATAQAVAVLKWAPAGTGTKVRAATGYVRAGTKQGVSVTGAAPGEALCTTAGAQKLAAHASSTGTAQFTVALPARTASTVVTVSKASGVGGRATLKALGAKRLPVALRATKIRKGRLQIIRVGGLAAGEAATVRVLGKVKRGHATRHGVFRTAVRVTGKPRRVKVVVRGQFGNRTNAKSFRVVR